MSAAAHRVGLLAEHAGAVPLLADWVVAAWPQVCGAHPARTRRQLRGWCRRDALPLGLVACDAQGTPLGLAALVHGLSPWRERIVLISTLLVAPPQRMRGLGRALCAAAGAQAARLGAPALHVYTTDAEPFFRRIGWQSIGDAIIDVATCPRAARFMRVDTVGAI